MIKISKTKLVILQLLKNSPNHTYGLKKEFDNIGGIATGTIYPIMTDLLDEGLITCRKTKDKLTYNITKVGQVELTSLRTNLAVFYQYINSHEEFNEVHKPK